MGVGQRIGWMNVLLATGLCGAVACSDPKINEVVPETAKGPPVQLAKGDGYRVAWSTPVATTVLALANLNETTRVGRLDLLRNKSEPMSISSGTDKNVKVSTTMPPKALFMESVGGGLAGTLIYADLTSGDRVVVPEGANAAVDGFWFGPTSDRIVFLSNPVALPVIRGTLTWSDGQSATAIGDNAASDGVVFSKNRDVLVAGIDLDGNGVGRLMYVDVKSGESKKIADNVKVVVGKWPGFAMDAAGKRVVFYTDAGEVMMWDSSGPLNTLANEGSAPGISSDGRMVAWLAGGKVVFSALAGETSSISGPGGEPITVQRPIQFSHDNTYLYWFNGGKAVTHNFVADAWVASTTVDQPAAKVGTNVSYDSFHFSRNSPRISAVTNLETTQGVSQYKALGRLGMSTPDAALDPLPSGREDGTPAKKAGVYAEDAAVLPDSQRIAFIEAGKAGTGVGEVFVTGEKPGDEPIKIGTNVMIGSLRATAAEFDRIAYAVQGKGAGKGSKALEDGTLFGALYVSKPSGAAKFLDDNAVHWEISSSGRVVTVIGQGDKAGVWTHPTDY